MMLDKESIARAIHFRGHDQGDDAWNHCQPHLRTTAREQATAAIEQIIAGHADIQQAVLSVLLGSTADRLGVDLDDDQAMRLAAEVMLVVFGSAA